MGQRERNGGDKNKFHRRVLWAPRLALIVGNSEPSFRELPGFWTSGCLTHLLHCLYLEISGGSCKFFTFHPHLCVSSLICLNRIHESLIQAGLFFWRDLAMSAVALGNHLGLSNGHELSSDLTGKCPQSLSGLSAQVFSSLSFHFHPYPGKLFSSLMILSQVTPSVIWQSAGERGTERGGDLEEICLRAGMGAKQRPMHMLGAKPGQQTGHSAERC